MATVRTDHKGWANITRVGVAFRDGVGETDDPAALAFFRRNPTYTVVEDGPAQPKRRRRKPAEQPTEVAEPEQPAEQNGE